MQIIRGNAQHRKDRIYAADDDFGDDFGGGFDDELTDEDEGIDDTLDNMADDIEDMQDSIDDIEEDDVDIDVDNNIANHYIAECDSCHGIFISAVIESDQVIDKISGVCPLCEKETEQYLKWVIKDINE